MPKVDKQLLINFADPTPKYRYVQNWPSGSKFLKLVSLPSGVFAYFLVPDVMLDNAQGELVSEEHVFIIAGPEVSVEQTDQFLDIVTVYTEVSQEELAKQNLPSDYQAVVIFPVFKREARAKSSLIAL